MVTFFENGDLDGTDPSSNQISYGVGVYNTQTSTFKFNQANSASVMVSNTVGMMIPGGYNIRACSVFDAADT
jgi:hypothetical protein